MTFVPAQVFANSEVHASLGSPPWRPQWASASVGAVDSKDE